MQLCITLPYDGRGSRVWAVRCVSFSWGLYVRGSLVACVEISRYAVAFPGRTVRGAFVPYAGRVARVVGDIPCVCCACVRDVACVCCFLLFFRYVM